MTFHVGQRVVCVDDSGGCDPRPVKGRIYTIASICWLSHRETTGEIGWGVTLVELPTFETEDYYAEYWARRFRPVQERPTSISFAHEILRKVTRKEPSHA